MCTKRFIALVAVAVTFASANYDMLSQATDSPKTAKLVPADTWSASPTVGAVNNTAAEIAEERVPRNPLLNWGTELSTTAKKSWVVKNIIKEKRERKPDFDPDLIDSLPEFLKKGLKEKIRERYKNGEPTASIIKALKAEYASHSKPVDAFVRAEFEALSTEFYVEAVKAINECVLKGSSKDHFKFKGKGGRKKFRAGELKFAELYYEERLNLMKRDINEYLGQALSVDQIIARMNPKGDRDISRHIAQLCADNASTRDLIRKIEGRLAEGVDPSQIHKELNPTNSGRESNTISFFIAEWHKKRDTEVYKMLREWVVVGKGNDEICKLLINRNLPKRLNDRDLEMFNHMSKYPIDKKFGLEPEVSGSWQTECAKGYRTLFEDSEIKLAAWEAKGMTPNAVSDELKLPELKTDTAEFRLNQALHERYKQRYENKNQA